MKEIEAYHALVATSSDVENFLAPSRTTSIAGPVWVSKFSYVSVLQQMRLAAAPHAVPNNACSFLFGLCTNEKPSNHSFNQAS